MNPQARFDEAVRLIDDGRLREARELLRGLAAALPDSLAVRLKLAQVNLDLGESDMAIEDFRQAIAMAPQSETASLGLFHCLWERGDQIEALNEVKRFISSGGCSDDYDAILQEINAA
jgi:predicted Zn-dependent protease